MIEKVISHDIHSRVSTEKKTAEQVSVPNQEGITAVNMTLH